MFCLTHQVSLFTLTSRLKGELYKSQTSAHEILPPDPFHVFSRSVCIFSSVFRNALVVWCCTDKQLSHCKCNFKTTFFFVSASACCKWCCVSWLWIEKDPCKLNIHLFYSGVSGIWLIPIGYFQLKKFHNFHSLFAQPLSLIEFLYNILSYAAE